MNPQDFKRILISFADSADDILENKGKITGIIRNEAIEIQLIDKEGELFIREDEEEIKARTWIAKRLAQLEQLADRIREFLPATKDFINPTGSLLDDIDIDPTETERPTDNVTECLREKLGQRIPGTTGVVYLTCDAGEGKTTIINHLAVHQAELFKKKRTDWLLVPIPLGGRPFLRFDDIVIASLVNRLRFRLFYYESFIEMVKLGLIVPAFDGFEEMFMVSSSGEALSATGQLMTKLNSSGNVLIAARKAYFDYKGFGAQAKLFDTISMDSVSFAKIGINRWNKTQFEAYALSREIYNGEEVYELIESQLGSDHPLLTRPVLVNQLLSVVGNDNNLDKISSSQLNSIDYFPNFVDTIITREADTKWIDTSGENKPLLTVSQHYELLAALAEEMWLNNTDSLSLSIVDLLADLYSESNGFSVQISRQIKERLKQHALLIKAEVANQLKFDHEEFKEFFLGVSFFNALAANRIQEFKNLLRKGLIFGQTIDVLANYGRKEEKIKIQDIAKIFKIIQLTENTASYVKENCGSLILKILSGKNSVGIILENYSFPVDSLKGVTLNNLVIRNSHFQPTAIFSTNIQNSLFEFCTFDSLEIIKNHNVIDHSILHDCEIVAVQNSITELEFYDPYNINRELLALGFNFGKVEVEEDNQVRVEVDQDLALVQKALRRFIRGSHLNDNVFRIKLGQNAEYFIDHLLPILINDNIIKEIEYQGAGSKRRFKLIAPFDKINFALKNSNGEFQKFLEKMKDNRGFIEQS
ncbi:hypothetical protein SAMN04487995_3148 [Dyadobacter koreensis]|uniref:NACHT domain-containing protein n=1 Tax=Dyadobacter koreensis TaxID=408657 RepID=A0A1H6VGD6_9BACT|nr:hypothetical protein [Dyadobacter koreensis]SEJ03613.1 hypothetical protein SAMN04487995_3148 [Dyadobacter koreensis]